jgi:hypothetical protein
VNERLHSPPHCGPFVRRFTDDPDSQYSALSNGLSRTGAIGTRSPSEPPEPADLRQSERAALQAEAHGQASVQDEPPLTKSSSGWAAAQAPLPAGAAADPNQTVLRDTALRASF